MNALHSLPCYRNTLVPMLQQRQRKQRRQRQRSSSSYCVCWRTTMVMTMMMIMMISITIMILTIPYTNAYQPGGIQSGPDSIGSAFASSATFDINKNTVIITGSTYGHAFDSDDKAGHTFGSGSGRDVTNTSSSSSSSSCFLVVGQLPTSETAQNGGMKWIESQIIQNSQTLQNKAKNTNYQSNDEKCTNILLHQNYVLVASHTLYDSTKVNASTLGPLIVSGQTTPSNTIGQLIQIDRNKLDLDGTTVPVVGGRVLDYPAVVYPVEMYGGPGDTYLYIVSQVSENIRGTSSDTSSTSSIVTSIVGNDPYQFFPVGKPLFLQISQYFWKSSYSTPLSPATIQNTLTSGWTKPYSTKDNMNSYVTGIIEVFGSILMVGYTAGIGDVFGSATISNTTYDGTYDGFITKLEKSTGNYYTGSSSTSTPSKDNGTSRRIHSLGNGQDKIMAICTARPAVESKYIYIVGYTSGTLDTKYSNLVGTKAFVMKLSEDTLTTEWTVEIGATATITDTSSSNGYVQGYGCAVTPDGDEVWVGGNVAYNGVVHDSGIIKSYGLTDVFVSKLSTSDGKIIFTRQFGSSQIDAMATRKGLLVDSNGNAIVIGNTFGSMYRKRSMNETSTSTNSPTAGSTRTADIFVTTISRSNGEIAKLVENPVTSSGVVTVPVSVPISAPVPVPVKASAPVPVKASAPVPVPTITSNHYDDSAGTTPTTTNITTGSTTLDEGQTSQEHKRHSSLIATLVILVLGTVLVSFFYINHPSGHKEIVTDRSKVLPYMGSFDVEEIDLKHSATGGWHCSYAGDLALGKNHKSDHSNYPHHILYDNVDPNNRSNKFTIDDRTIVDDDPLDPIASYSISSGLLHVPGSTNSGVGGLDGYSKLGIRDDENFDGTTGRSSLLRNSSLYDDDVNDDTNDNDPTTNRHKSSSSSRRGVGYDDLISSEFNTTWGNSSGTSKKNNKSGTKRVDSWGKDII